MELETTFAQFLQSTSILSQHQVDDLDTTMSKQDEDQKIFTLADFFRCLSASDCYDLSLRLYMSWKRSETSVSETQPSLQKVHDHTPRKSALKTPRNDTSMTTVHSNRKNRLLSPDVSDCDVKPVIARCNTVMSQNSGIFDSDQKTARNRELKRGDSERKNLEDEECTFQPKITKTNMARSAVNVFGRLQRDPRNEKREINEIKKAQREIQGCTFQPEVVKSSIDVTQPPEAILSRTFDRLFRESQRRKNNSIDYELRKKELEVRGCTFRPETTHRTETSPAEAAARSEKLHKLHEERERNLMKKKIERSMEEENKYSFRPQIHSSPKRRDGSKDIYERLLEWKEKKNRKVEMQFKEKARKEEGMSQERHLTTRRKEDNDNSRDQSSIHDRLYQDSTKQKMRKEKIVQDVLKDMGASFKPKINGKSRNSSAKELRRQPNSFQLVSTKESRQETLVEDERMPLPRQTSPEPEKFSRNVNPFKDVKNLPSTAGEIPTATFGK